MQVFRVSHSVRTALRLIDRPSTIFIVACVVPIAALEVGMVLATWFVFKLLLGANSGGAVLDDPGRLAFMLGGILFFMTIRTLGVTALWALVARRLAAQQQRLASRLFEAYLKLPYARIMGANRSRMLEKLRIASRALLQEMLLPVLYFLGDSLVAIAVLATMFILSPGPTIVVSFWLLVVFGVIYRIVYRISRRLSTRRWQVFQSLRELDEWTLLQARSIRLAGDEDIVMDRHRALGRETAGAMAGLAVTASLPRYISEFALLTSSILLFLWFSHAGETSATVLRDLSMFTVAGMRLLPTGQRAISMMSQLQQGLPDTAEILNDLAAPQADLPPPPAKAADGPLFESGIALCDVAFTYGDGDDVVPQGTSLSLRRGEWLQVSGPSGIGKSTLVGLLLGFLEPSRGQIMIDGSPAAMLERLRGRAVALVAQDHRLLRGTVAENLAFPAPLSGLDRDAAKRLITALGLDIDLDTPVGEDGTRLSGGQRQRLAIARALLGRPQLLVLDEATSQLDAMTERAVFALIRQSLPEATVVVVAHKLDRGVDFDRRWAWSGDRWLETGASA